MERLHCLNQFIGKYMVKFSEMFAGYIQIACLYASEKGTVVLMAIKNVRDAIPIITALT
jgi:hypothetical protein